MLNMKPLDEPLPRYLELYKKIDCEEKMRTHLLDEIQMNEHELHNNLEPQLIEDYQDFLL